VNGQGGAKAERGYPCPTPLRFWDGWGWEISPLLLTLAVHNNIATVTSHTQQLLVCEQALCTQDSSK